MSRKKRLPIIGPIFIFLKEAYIELRKVSWPKKKEVVGMVIVIVASIIIGAILIGALDYGLTYGAKTLLLK